MKVWILATLRAIAFWTLIALGVIGLSGLYAELNQDTQESIRG